MSLLNEYLERGAAALGVTLDQGQLGKCATFALELIKWNRKINLTSIVRLDEIATKHFIDSLSVVPYLNASGDLLDIGSGGGFPAIPLKIALPDLTVVSVDAVEKKILFQRHVARLIHLEKFIALHARAETLPQAYGDRFDRIISRAFSDIPTFVKLALPLLAPDGVMVAMKGKEGRREAADAADRLDQLDTMITEIVEFELPLLGEARSVVIIRKKERLKSDTP